MKSGPTMEVQTSPLYLCSCPPSLHASPDSDFKQLVMELFITTTVVVNGGHKSHPN